MKDPLAFLSSPVFDILKTDESLLESLLHPFTTRIWSNFTEACHLRGNSYRIGGPDVTYLDFEDAQYKKYDHLEVFADATSYLETDNRDQILHNYRFSQKGQ